MIRLITGILDTIGLFCMLLGFCALDSDVPGIYYAMALGIGGLLILAFSLWFEGQFTNFKEYGIDIYERKRYRKHHRI